MFCGERILIFSKSRKIMPSEQILGLLALGTFYGRLRDLETKDFL